MGGERASFCWMVPGLLILLPEKSSGKNEDIRIVRTSSLRQGQLNYDFWN
jgi:hypothetical protein